MKLLGFKPTDGECVGDAMPFYHHDEWHVFYLKSPMGALDPFERSFTSMAHVSSKDLISWEEMPDCFGLGQKGDADEAGCWAGSVIEREGVSIFSIPDITLISASKTYARQLVPIWFTGIKLKVTQYWRLIRNTMRPLIGVIHMSIGIMKAYVM